MLTNLYVRHFAVVEEAEFAVSGGLTVITGETGAGKSLLVDALTLLSGARADNALVRSGEKRAELHAEFALDDRPGARDWLEQQDLDDDDNCQLRRVLKAGGSSRAWINGRPATLTQLSQLAAHLVEIHGQHEHQALLSRRHQLDLVDAFAGAGAVRAKVAEAAAEWRRLRQHMDELGDANERPARIELLQHELEQLSRWVIPATDFEQLEADHRRLANSDRLLEGVNAAAERLDGDSDFAVNRSLAGARTELEHLQEMDDSLAAPLDLLANAGIQIDETVAALNHYASAIEPQPERLAEIDEQLSQLHALARRHRLPIDQLGDKQAELERELDSLQGAGERLDELARQSDACMTRYRAAADKLAKARRKAARTLGQEVTALMQQLGMAGGRFEVAMTETSDSHDATPDPLGDQRCELMVSANPGQPARPLRKVASGGELSRISLAIKVATLDSDRRATMVFDEVDSGIGGGVAEVVGRKLRSLGDNGQVLCVTHLPQVAAQAHAHLRVAKASNKGDTRTQVETLDQAARRAEVARMLGGLEITTETEAHARQMIERAQTG